MMMLVLYSIADNGFSQCNIWPVILGFPTVVYSTAYCTTAMSNKMTQIPEAE